MKTTAPAGAEPRHALLLEQQLCFSLYSSVHAMNRVYRGLLRRLGLTYPQYLVMLVLWEQDGQSVSALGQRLFLDSATLTPLLKRLQASGVVERLRSVADERQVIVSLTRSGRALRRAAETLPEAVLRATGCAPEELKGLKARLEQLRGRLLAAA